jgi:hypothetical protein
MLTEEILLQVATCINLCDFTKIDQKSFKNVKNKRLVYGLMVLGSCKVYTMFLALNDHCMRERAVF